MLATNLLLAIALLLLYYCSALPGGRPSQGSGLEPE